MSLCSVESHPYQQRSAIPTSPAHTWGCCFALLNLYNPQNAKWLFIPFSPQWHFLSQMRGTLSSKLFHLCCKSHMTQFFLLLPAGLFSWSSNSHSLGSRENTFCSLLSIPCFSHLFSHFSPEFFFSFFRKTINQTKINQTHINQCKCLVDVVGQWAGWRMCSKPLGPLVMVYQVCP